MSVLLILVGVSLMLFMQYKYPFQIETQPYKKWYSLSMLLWLSGVVWTFFTYPILVAIGIAISSFVVKAILQSVTEGKGTKLSPTGERLDKGKK